MKKAHSPMKRQSAILFCLLMAEPVKGEDNTIPLDCIFTSAASVHETGLGQTSLENYRLPADFFADFSMVMSTESLANVTIDRWASFNAQVDVGLLKPQVCRNDGVTLTCTGSLGDMLFLDLKTLKGSAVIPGKSGYAAEVVVSFFRCNKIG
jgi:hypothetical protein